MRQDFITLLEEATAKYRTSRLVPAQLEYMAAKSLYDTIREQAETEYMWNGEGELTDAMLEIAAAHDVEVDQKYGVYEAEEYHNEKRANLIAWSQEMSVKIARKHGASQKVIQDITEMHQNIHRHPVQQQKLIDIALRLNAKSAI